MARFVLLLVALAVVLYVANSQEMVTVPLTVGENTFDIQFVPTEQGVRDITTQFCEQRGADFGITDAANMDVCTVPVMNNLAQYIKQPESESESESAAPVAQQQASMPSISEIKVPLKIGESEYEISFEPTAAGASSVAVKFCQEQGSSFGITKENFNEACLIPIEGFLNKAAEDNTRVKRELQVKQEALAAEEAALASMPDDVMVNMQIGEYVFDVAWNSKRTNAKNMAIKFCNEQSAALNIGFEDCVVPVEKHLSESSATQVDPQGEAVQEAAKASTKIVKAKVNVAGKEYEFRFEQSEADALKVATHFCRDQGPALGVKPETADAQCVKPILNTLLAALERVSRGEEA